MLLTVLLHAAATNPIELLALVGPVSILVGAGFYMVVKPVLQAGSRNLGRPTPAAASSGPAVTPATGPAPASESPAGEEPAPASQA